MEDKGGRASSPEALDHPGPSPHLSLQTLLLYLSAPLSGLRTAPTEEPPRPTGPIRPYMCYGMWMHAHTYARRINNNVIFNRELNHITGARWRRDTWRRQHFALAVGTLPPLSPWTLGQNMFSQPLGIVKNSIQCHSPGAEHHEESLS